MGVDSNVLIFERIGRTARVEGAVSAVDQGFQARFLTIIDTHLQRLFPLRSFHFRTGRYASQ